MQTRTHRTDAETGKGSGKLEKIVDRARDNDADLRDRISEQATSALEGAREEAARRELR